MAVGDEESESHRSTFDELEGQSGADSLLETGLRSPDCRGYRDSE